MIRLGLIRCNPNPRACAIIVGISIFWLLVHRIGLTPPIIGLVALFGLAGLFTKGGGLLAYGISWPFLGLGMQEGGQGTLITLSALAAVGGYVARELSEKKYDRFIVSRTIYVIVFIIGVLASLAFISGLLTGSQTPRATDFWVLMISLMLLALAIAHYASDTDGIKLLLSAFVFSACVAAALSLSDSGISNEARLGLQEGAASLRRLSNTLSLGILALLSFKMFGHQLGSTLSSRWLQALQYMILAVLVSVLLLTASRGALLGVIMAFSVGVLVMLHRKKIRLQKLVIVLTGLVGLIIAFIFFDPGSAFAKAFPVLAGRVGVESVDDPRMEFWQEALRNTEWTVFVLGGGVLSWSEFAQIEAGFSAHSFFVDWLYVFGIPGLFVACLFFYSVIMFSKRRGQDWVFLWLVFFVFGFATYGTVTRVAPWILIGMILSTVLATQARRNRL
ncbi:hypothetical protein CKO25_19510 [Thiocapsa imhoffii]|uniref:O-antigen ligase-related domain-containing protein n=1 Tax=Thiocapsa imhoffii TaxID=382777 RepID=A0A9X0WM20_9GAMM|nr:O-antigen ligase family protein [Thiocapsa imhoffii]MBK1646785.1 hypothetical protein [Thiocapsa imhoffii]